ncbi:PREDICTED: E3 ubiquitin-protein ligase hel2-like [Camelina sativa]|uniref:RING-type E3 ubiquitin transferase n=1 Tax=Camelina sativa TaxID=90675 RepID=A0ABM0YW46_CAMSA|nr:PREDICTED: E3 ubiquitin-protein ligase hel2-like [Camelina sativa]
MDDSCAVCAESLEWVAYGSCGHREVCSTCVVRLRFIFSDTRCCICKTECPIVFVTKALGDDYTKTISDFSTTFPSVPKEGRVGSFWYHEETKVFFDDLNQYIKVKAMCRLSCTSCDETKKVQPKKGPKHRLRFKSVEQLKDHLNHQHKLHMCSLCLVGRKVFICEQKLFTKAQLNQHISSGDSEVDGNESERGGFTGHPMCEFCKRPFYGDNELYTHMSREHYTCHICQRLKPGQYEYYGNYDNLEVHFRTDHFLCEDETCLAKKFVVFQFEAELKRHNSIDHGGSRMSRSQQSTALQIQSSFQYQNSHRRRRRSSYREPSFAALESQASYAINEGSTHLQHVGSSGGSRLGEYSFPPLSVQANRGPTRFGQNSESLLGNTMTTRLRHQTNRSATSGSSRAWPALNRRPTQASITSSVQSSGASAQSHSRNHGRVEMTRTLASAIPQDARNEHTTVGGCSSGSSPSSGNAKRNNHHLSSTPKMSNTRSLEQHSHSNSPISAAQNRRSPSTNGNAANILVAQGVSSDVQPDNKSLVEKIRASLGHDEELFMAFKDTSGKYRHGTIDARTYLEYVNGYGLSYLVVDLARLCPDPQRQKELIDTHNACLRGGNKGKAVKVESSSDSKGDRFVDTMRKLQLSDKSQDEDKDKDAYRPDKGKTKVNSSSAGVGLGGNTDNQRKKTSKFLRTRLGEKSMAAVLDIRNSNPEPEPESKNENPKRSQNSPGGLPLRGAWRRGSAKLFI